MIIYCASLLSHKITKVPLFSRKKKDFVKKLVHNNGFSRRRSSSSAGRIPKAGKDDWKEVECVPSSNYFSTECGPICKYTYSNDFTGKIIFFVKSIQFNYFGINDMVDKWNFFFEIAFFWLPRPFFIFYLDLNHFLKSMSVSHDTVCSSKDLWLIILWKSLEIRIFNTQKYLFRMIHVKKIKGSCYWSWTPISLFFIFKKKLQLPSGKFNFFEIFKRSLWMTP